MMYWEVFVRTGSSVAFWHAVVPWGFCGGIALCFTAWACAYLGPLRRSGHAVERLAALPVWTDESLDVTACRARVAEHVAAEGSEPLQGLYASFKARWQRQCAADGVSTVDPESLLTLQALLPPGFASAFAPSVPGFFTGMGLLGTVLGLVLGLHGVSFGQGPAAAGFLATVKPLLSGMFTAFVASVAGISASLAWSALDDCLRGRLAQALDRLNRLLRTLYPVRQDRELLQAIALSSASVQETVQRWRSDSTALQEQTVKSLAADFHAALLGAARAQFASLATAIEAAARAQAAHAADLEMLGARLAAATRAAASLADHAKGAADRFASAGADAAATQGLARDALHKLESGVRDLERELGRIPGVLQREAKDVCEREARLAGAAIHEKLSPLAQAVERLEEAIQDTTGRTTGALS